MLIAEESELEELKELSNADYEPIELALSNQIEEELIKRIKEYERERIYIRRKKIRYGIMCLSVLFMLAAGVYAEPVRAWCSRIISYITERGEKDTAINTYSVTGDSVNEDEGVFELGRAYN